MNDVIRNQKSTHFTCVAPTRGSPCCKERHWQHRLPCAPDGSTSQNLSSWTASPVNQCGPHVPRGRCCGSLHCFTNFTTQEPVAFTRALVLGKVLVPPVHGSLAGREATSRSGVKPGARGKLAEKLSRVTGPGVLVSCVLIAHSICCSEQIREVS